jgi:stage 0 sporulation regulatory protein
MYDNEPSEMLEAIKVKRESMINCATKKGFTCEETIRFSQELDVLINEYQKVTLHSNEEVKIAFKQMIMIWPKVCM